MGLDGQPRSSSTSLRKHEKEASVGQRRLASPSTDTPLPEPALLEHVAFGVEAMHSEAFLLASRHSTTWCHLCPAE